MSEKTQNDWDVVGDALMSHPGGHTALDAIAAFDRLREINSATVAGLNERVTELDGALRECVRAMEAVWENHGNEGKPWPLREYTIARKALGEDWEEWPVPAPLPTDYWESAG